MSANANEARSVNRQAELATASIGHAGVIGALQNERNLALVEMLGLADELELEVDRPGRRPRSRPTRPTAALRRGIGDQSTRCATTTPPRSTQSSTTCPTCGPTSTPPAGRRAWPTASGPTRCSRRTRPWSSTLFASHDRFSLVVDDAGAAPGRRPASTTRRTPPTRRPSWSRRSSTSARARGASTSRPRRPRSPSLRRDVGKNNDVVRVEGNRRLRSLRPRTLLANPQVDGLPVLADRPDRPGRLGRPGRAAGHHARSAPTAATRRSATRWSTARRPGRLAARRGRGRRRLYLGGASPSWWPPPSSSPGAVSRSITRPAAAPQRQGPRRWPPTACPPRCRTSSTRRRARTWSVPEADPIVVSARDEVADVASAFNDVQHSAARPRGRAGRAAPQRGRVLRQPGAPQPEPAQPAARRGRRARAGRDRPPPARPAPQARPPGHPHPPQRRVAARAVAGRCRPPASRRRWQSPTSCGPRSARSRTTSGSSCARSTRRCCAARASTDLAHLLAELIENGLRHSPPRELVEVSGRAGRGRLRDRRSSTTASA